MNYLWLLYISFYIVIISYYIVFLFYLLNLISRVYCSIFQNQTKFQNATVKSTIHTSNSSNTVLLFPFLGNSPNVYIQINDEIYALFKFLPLKKIVRQIHNWSCFFLHCSSIFLWKENKNRLGFFFNSFISALIMTIWCCILICRTYCIQILREFLYFQNWNWEKIHNWLLQLFKYSTVIP
jgi:hypothetical protein